MQDAKGVVRTYGDGGRLVYSVNCGMAVHVSTQWPSGMLGVVTTCLLLSASHRDSVKTYKHRMARTEVERRRNAIGVCAHAGVIIPGCYFFSFEGRVPPPRGRAKASNVSFYMHRL